MGILGLGELDSTLGWTLGSYGNRLLLRHSREFHWGWGGGGQEKIKEPDKMCTHYWMRE